jgi:NAD(P)-dependent dehydrogenase (short-subunit alcohol dehydrogenase family)
MAGRFEGRVAVVTGGASGLGEATARLLVAEGGQVVIADMGDARGRAVADSLGAAATFVHCDVTVESEVAAAIDAAPAAFGRLDAVFANAGIVGIAGPIADTPMDDFDRTVAVLLRGVFVTVKHAARVLLAQGTGGAIVMTSSVAGVQGGLGPHAYSVCKSGVISLAKSASSELAHHGIRVNAVAPGSIPTAMTAHVSVGDPDAIEAATARIAKQSPLGRAGLPRDIAEAVLYLVSDAGSYVTGQTIVVDAGVTTGAAMNPTWARTAMVVARPTS